VSSENVFNILGLGRQSGDFYSPGTSVPATFLYPVEAPVTFELDRGSAYPKQDRGRNVRNNRNSGYYGVRGASTSLESQVRFGDVMDILEMIYCGDVTPVSLGGGLYRWDYPFEAGSPTVVPYTLEGGNIDNEDAQMRLVSCLVGQLTMGFPDITVPGAAPWTLSGDIIAFDREIAEVTDPLEAREDLEVAQGHLTRLYEGDTSEAFAALAELVSSLKSFTMTPNRNLVARAYGGTTDMASAFGYTDQSNGTFEMKVGISPTSRSDFHDVWNATAPTPIGEKRLRLASAGAGGREFRVDARGGLMAVPYDEADGERLFKVTGEFVDDDALEASHVISVTNTVSTLV
jgi:hypothetical protein